MNQFDIQLKIIRKLMQMSPQKWGRSHTQEINLKKSFPKHVRGSKLMEKAIKDLYENQFLLKSKKTGEWHVSLNPRKKKEIMKFLKLGDS